MRERNARNRYTKKEQELEDLGKSQPILLQKSEKACSEVNTEGVAEQPFDKEVAVGVSHRFNQPPQPKSVVKMGLYQQTYRPLELRGTEYTGWDEKGLPGFWDSTGGDSYPAAGELSFQKRDK